MMKLIVMKGKYVLCARIYTVDNNIKYVITGNGNTFLNYGLFDGETIRFLHSTEGILTTNGKDVNDFAVFALDNNNTIVAYGSTPDANQKKFDECYRNISTLMNNKEEEKSLKSASDEKVIKLENNGLLDNNSQNHITNSYKIEKNTDNFAKLENIGTVQKKAETEITRVDENIADESVDSEEDIKNIGEFLEKKSDEFYEDIKGQLSELFEKYPRNSELETLVMDSKWVNVDYDSKSYYTVGVIKEGEEVSVICYGVPCQHKSEPPKEIAEYCQWLPLDKENIEKAGY